MFLPKSFGVLNSNVCLVQGTEEDWNDRTKQQAVYNDPNDQKPRLKPQFDQEPNLDFESYEQIEESISNLTQGNYKRNGFNYSVKIGWF